MSAYDYDLFVIGAGSGGVRGSRMAAGMGKKVAVAEDMFLGGTCVNVGCVPKKLFVYASHFGEDFHDSQGFGWSVNDKSFNWKTLIENKNKEISRLNGIYENLLKNAGVELISGRATLVDAHTVEVAGKQYTAEKILVAVGGWPSVPEIPGKEYISTSNDAFYLEELPERIIVVGGGYIAVEFAGIFNGVGANVTQLYRSEKILRGFDEDIRGHLSTEIVRKGVDLRVNSNIASIEKTDSGLLATLEDGSKIEADFIMYATGRSPKTANLGLEAAGVEMDKAGAIIVNDDFQTSQPNIYALGDVINRVQLTPVAIEEAMVLVHNLFAGEDRKMDYDNIPTAVFSQPSVGTVGLTEAQAREQYGEIDVYKSDFRPMKFTLTENQERTLMKLIVDRKSDKVLGLHMVGPDAGEIVQGMGIALKAGATKAHFDATIGIHPSSAEEFVTMRSPVSS
ncbi:glutathione-disulfide reductase [Curvivirga aplysinae]|uniref:glutathione-disulfide reductase n=1 Tax=Curvivirga aplysinae TaxID=2529852 RepID=UPI0012BCD3A2|nr:glutathione-disulfide reductase [Curvivirga aplysinae]MTI09260.1 glutathione-disulfide reductase [Curvivirga aplysinae]